MPVSSKTTSDIDDLIVSFLCNETTAAENAVIADWMHRSEGNRDRFIELRNTYMALLPPIDNSRLSVDGEWKRFLDRISSSHQAESKSNGRKTIVSLRRLCYAAAVAAVLCCGVFMSYRFSNVCNQKSRLEDPTVFSASFGSRAYTVLPDGTKIWLNSGSTISCPPDYNVSEREVKLEGEAYFDVTTNPDKPFVVRAKNITITATGTAFNVSAYNNDNSVITTLIHGIITISGERIVEPIRVVPNQTIEYFCGDNAVADMALALEDLKPSLAVVTGVSVDADSPVVKVADKAETYTSWKSDRWVIDGERLESLAHKIERRYNVSLYFTNEAIKSYRFNGSFKNETIDEVMYIIHKALPIKYKIDNGIVLLFSDNEMQKVFDSATSQNFCP